MGNVIKVNACVYTRMGYGRENNTNDFYLNGKFMSDQHLENVQASLENRGNEYFFAIADNMEVSSDTDASVSILKEMVRYHEKITVNGGDLDFKMKELSSRSGDLWRLSESILDVNHVPEGDPARNLGFASLLLTEGQMVAATAGSARAYVMRGDHFESLARESNKTQKLVNMGVITEDEATTVLEGTLEALKSKSEEEETDSPIILSKPIDLEEDDKYLLVSQAVVEALGEERLEDILAMRSDSNYIAGKIVSEAMKRSVVGDMTAMVVMIEKVYDNGGSKKSNFKSRVDALHKSPTVSYKYAKKSSGRFEGGAFLVLVLLTAAVLIWIVYIIINAMIGGNTDKPVRTPVPTTIATIAPTPDVLETTPPATTEPTPSPTPDTTEKEYVVKSGDTLNRILIAQYGDASMLDAFMKYNNISNANSLQIGQKLKIPPKDALK